MNDELPHDHAPPHSLRQKKISAIIEDVLPRIMRSDEKESPAQKATYIIAIFLACYLGGYLAGENLRTLNYSEKVLLSTLIAHTAKMQHISEEKVEETLCHELGANKIKNIRAYQWPEALKILGEYVE